MLRLAFDFIITWRETRTRPNAYNGAIHCIIAYNGLDYTCRECIPSISFRFTSLSETPVPFASFFLKETFLYIALFPDFIRIFIDWKKRINTR